MTRSDYISSSAKLLFISSLLLLVANIFTMFSDLGSKMAETGSTLSTISFYVVFLFSFIAFNGEGIAHKRGREFKKKRITTLLKLAVLFPFLYRFVKVYVIGLFRLLIVINGNESFENFANIFLAVINTFASYGYVLMLVSLWYLFRDSNQKSLFLAESASFLVSICYSIYKVFYYAINNYKLDGLGQMFSEMFSNKAVYNGLCIAQYALNGVMFLIVAIHYGKKAKGEQEAYKQAQKKSNPAINIYNTDCVGIDTLDDNFS